MRLWRLRLFHKSTSHAPLTFALRTWCLDLSTDFTSKSTREHKDDDIFHTLFFNAVANTWTKYVAWLMQFTAWKLIFKIWLTLSKLDSWRDACLNNWLFMIAKQVYCFPGSVHTKRSSFVHYKVIGQPWPSVITG